MSITKPNFSFEERFPSPVAGIDEVGYGAWAGPLVACATILYPSILPIDLINSINDSKKLSKKSREQVYANLISFSGKGVFYSLSIAKVEEIDSINVYEANLLAMKRAFESLPIQAKTAIIDGIRTPVLGVTCIAIPQGDQISLTIAAASILAKVTRDRIMEEFSKEYPEYGWEKNVGYGTAYHHNAIKKYGITQHHRKSYKPIKMLLK